MGLFIKQIIKFFIFIFTLSITFILFFIILSILDTPKLDISIIDKNETTFIYDKYDNLIYTIGDKINEYVKYEDISKNLIDALISTEDTRFFTHNGLDYKRILSSSLNNLKKGEYDEGASTITQQLIKNVYLTSDKTIERKIKEMYLALQIEKKLSKEEILEKYLNNILFGKRIYGIETASKFYFNKNAKDLDINESSILVALIQLPNYYIKNLDKLTERKNIVLKKMYENNYIKLEEYEEFKTKKIEGLNSYIKNDSIYYSYIDVVLDELDNLNVNYNKESHKVYTNLDPSIQGEISNIFKNKYNNFPDDLLNCGVVCMDNYGLIEAIGGNRSDIGLNYATTPLQPGSTIKPILDYAPCFEYYNYTPSTIISDSYETYSNGEKINNFDRSYMGDISLREALRYSRNIPSLKLFKQLNDKAFDFSKNLGITLNEPIHESMSIGGFETGYSVLDMTNAYLGFANMGYYTKSKTIRKIDNETLTINLKRVMKPSTAYLINSILHDVIKNSKYNIKDNYMCAKTGQSNFDRKTKQKNNIPSYGVKDSWYIGYNKHKTIGVWCGYDNNKYYMTNKTKDTPRNIFKKLFESYNISSTNYEKPSNLKKFNYYYDNDYFLTDEFSISFKNRYDYFYIDNAPKDRWLNYLF